jgi:hypothetical protein
MVGNIGSDLYPRLLTPGNVWGPLNTSDWEEEENGQFLGSLTQAVSALWSLPSRLWPSPREMQLLEGSYSVRESQMCKSCPGRPCVP